MQEFQEIGTCLINLFFLPAITMYLYCKRTGRSLAFSGENLCLYAIITVFVNVLCKFAAAAIRRIFGLSFTICSSYFTLFGIILAAAGGIFLEMLTKYISLRIEAKENEK